MSHLLGEIWTNSTHGERCLLALCGTALGAGAIYAGHRSVVHLIDTHDYYGNDFSIVHKRSDRHRKQKYLAPQEHDEE